MTDKYIATTVEFRLTEDDWTQGELQTLSVWHDDEDFIQHDTIEDLLKSIKHLDCDWFYEFDVHKTFENDPCGFQKQHEYCRFDADLLVDVDDSEHIIKPTPEIYEQWKAGKHMLYSLHISVYIKKIIGLAADDVKAWH